MAKLRNKKQFGRFSIIGIANTTLDFAILFGLRSLGVPLLMANIVSTTTAFVSSFIANRKYTFKSTGDSAKRQFILFVVVTLFGLWVLQSIVLWLSEDAIISLIGNETYGLIVAKLLATLVSMSWNYILYAKFVFKKSTNSSEQ